MILENDIECVPRSIAIYFNIYNEYAWVQMYFNSFDIHLNGPASCKANSTIA